MLKKLLTAMALVSLMCTAAVGILWLRAAGGHADPFTIPWIGVKYQFSSIAPNGFDPSRWAVRAVRQGDLGWYTETHYLKFKEVMGYTLIVPAIWLAILIRGLIPRPTPPAAGSHGDAVAEVVISSPVPAAFDVRSPAFRPGLSKTIIAPMSVYLITLHAYRSWGPDKSRGFVRKETGAQPTDDEMARMYDGQAADNAVTFTAEIQGVLITGAADICRERGWRLHAVGTDPTHGHFLLSQVGFMDWQYVRDKLKNLLSLFLGRLAGEQGRRWFVAEGSRKRVEDRDHFDYLVEKYLPDHRGVFWKEGDPLPEIPDGIL